MSQAIRHATMKWKVDIITMSFGWPCWHKCVEEAIQVASDHNIILFAAASNNGSNQPVVFPANYRSVICVHSTTGFGNPSQFTPLPLSGSHNFAVIGEAVSSSWPNFRGEGREMRRSGTSTSTPILAAIAALVLEFVNQMPFPAPQELRLRSAQGMSQVLLAMSDSRSGYMVVKPWKILDSQFEHSWVQTRISLSLIELFGPESSTPERSM